MMSKQSSRAMALCTAILVAACASASLIFACATPFAAFAVLAAAALPLPRALVAVAVAWAVNQAIGFGILGYPHDLNAIAWGAVMLGATLLTTAAAASVFWHFSASSRYAVYPVALMAAYGVYEVLLLAFVPAFGGGDAFTVEIVGRLAFVNAIWLVALIVAYELLRRLNSIATGDPVRERVR